MKQIGIRELRARISEIIAAGEAFELTHRGAVVYTCTPMCTHNEVKEAVKCTHEPVKCTQEAIKRVVLAKGRAVKGREVGEACRHGLMICGRCDSN